MRITLTHEQHVARLAKCKNAQERAHLMGDSPGSVAARLGVSRQAVYSAVNKGNLDAVTILDREGAPMALIVTDASVDEYLARRRWREKKREAQG